MPQIPTVSPGGLRLHDELDNLGDAADSRRPRLQANMAALQGKEALFAGKVAASNVAYQGSEDSGEQGVMK